MKKCLRLYIIATLTLFLFERCQEEPKPTVPTVSTASATSITNISAVSGGNIIDDGGAKIIARGVCWSKQVEPTIENDTTNQGSRSGPFVSTLLNLEGGTTYYLRAYATNKFGTAYGGEITFTTTDLPTVSTTSVSDIAENSAVSGGTILSDGNLPITARGVCWSTSTNPTITTSNKTVDGSGTGIFISTLTGLTGGTTYFVRAYATNGIGTSYGEEIQFSTNSIIKTIYASKDASIFNNQTGTSGNGDYGSGGSELLQVGYASPSMLYARTLLQFDLSSIPNNAIIENVILQFTQGSSGSATSYTLNIHKLEQGWTEGATAFCTYNNSCNTQGVAIAPGGTDVTWNEFTYSGANTNPWTTTGGTFNTTVSASAAAGTTTVGTAYSFTSDGLKDDVQLWVSNASINFGWIIKTDFITTSSAMKRFYSREGAAASGDPATAPKLIVTYRQ